MNWPEVGREKYVLNSGEYDRRNVFNAKDAHPDFELWRQILDASGEAPAAAQQMKGFSRYETGAAREFDLEMWKQLQVPAVTVYLTNLTDDSLGFNPCLVMMLVTP